MKGKKREEKEEKEEGGRLVIIHVWVPFASTNGCCARYVGPSCPVFGPLVPYDGPVPVWAHVPMVYVARLWQGRLCVPSASARGTPVRHGR